ncbi:unnamed protein product [Meloidogyne enterolobii]|nr:unnamed protein product [Meloidogyne enterolobii]
MKEEAQKKLELTKRLFNALQVVLYETNNLLDWEEYYNEATKEEENNEEKEKDGKEEEA